MQRYTYSEYVDMLLTLGECHGSARAAERRYQEKFPARHVPNYKTFLCTERRLRERGTLKGSNFERGRRRTVRNVLNEENILNSVEANPRLSTRRLAMQHNMSHVSVWNVLREQQFHPYHYRQAQDILPQDRPLRRQFSQLLLERQAEDPMFLSNIIFSDEATFTRSGVFNMRNEHVWAENNPHAKKVTHYQHSFKLNVWAATLGNNLLGYHILPGNLTGDMYRQFLSNRFYEFLEDIPLIRRGSLWYMHDGAPPHFNLQCRQWLNEHFPNRWIGRGHDAAINWPPRSPDLNPMDFNVWGQMKQKVYSEAVDNEQQLRQRIENAFDQLTIEHKFNRNLFSLENRLHACNRANGGHFET